MLIILTFQGLPSLIPQGGIRRVRGRLKWMKSLWDKWIDVNGVGLCLNTAITEKTPKDFIMSSMV